MNEIDEQYNNNYFNEDLIKQSEKLPNEIKKSINKGKIIEKEWDDNNLPSLINDCIIIENNIKETNKINDNIQKTKSNQELKIDYNIDEPKIKNLIEMIQNFGKIVIDDEITIYDDFKIETKRAAHILKNHKEKIYCLCVMKDGRLVSGSRDSSIIIYNKNTYQPDLIIDNQHNDSITCLTQLNSGILVSCSFDKTIKLFNINDNKYEICQTLNSHNGPVSKLIELKNKTLVSCSYDSSIIFYVKDNNQYKKDFQHSASSQCNSIIQIKDNEICYSESNNSQICFYNFIERQIKATISNISKHNGIKEWFLMITKDLLLIPGINKISIVNTNQYKLVRIIDVPNAGKIIGVCKLNKNMLLTADYSTTIRQWKIEGDNLTLISQKKNTHDGRINYLLNMKNGLIASCSHDKSIILW